MIAKVPNRAATVVSISLALVGAAAEAQPPVVTDSEETRLLQDVCLAVACDEARLAASPRPAAERLATVRNAALANDIAAVYRGLDSVRDPVRGASLDETSALSTV